MTEIWVALFASSPPAAAVLISLNWFLSHLQGERTAQQAEREEARDAISTTITTALANNSAVMQAQTTMIVAQLERFESKNEAWRDAIVEVLSNNTAAMTAQTAVMTAQLDRLKVLGEKLETKAAEP